MEGDLNYLKCDYSNLQLPQKTIYLDIVNWLLDNLNTIETDDNKNELIKRTYLLRAIVSNNGQKPFVNFLKENKDRFNDIFALCQLNEQQKQKVKIFQMRLKNSLEVFDE